MELERSEVRWGRTDIPYFIRRSDRRATVGIAVEPSGTVVLTAPRATSLPRLDKLVRDKARWIVERVRRRESLPSERAREFVSGETFLYLGRQYRLRLLRRAEARPIALRAGWLELRMPPGLETSERSSYARGALVEWYTRLAEERLPTWTAAWADRMGLSFSDVMVTDQAKRWGSCAKGVLRFNWRIIPGATSPRRLCGRA